MTALDAPSCRGRTAWSEGQAAGGALDALPDLVAVLDCRGRITAVNRAWEQCGQRGGAVSEAGVGTDYLSVCRRAQRAGDDLAGRALEGLEAVLAGDVGCFELDYSFASPDDLRWFTMTATPGPDGSGAIVVHRDSTGREEESDRLRRANRRLDDLARTIAVEVAQPVTALVLALRQLEHAHHGDLDAVGDRLITIALESGEAIGDIVANLVAYTRDDVPDPSAGAVDLGALAHGVLHQLHPMLDHEWVTVHVGPLPVVVTDPVQLRALLTDLLAQMVARRPGVPRVVELSGDRLPRCWSIVVAESPVGAVLDPDATARGGVPGLAQSQAAAARLGAHLFTFDEPSGTSGLRLILPDRDAKV